MLKEARVRSKRGRMPISNVNEVSKYTVENKHLLWVAEERKE